MERRNQSTERENKKNRFVNYKKRSTPSVEYFQFRPRRITKPVISNYVLLCTHGRMNCIDVQTSVGLCGTSKNYRNIPSNADCNLDSAPVTCNKVVRIIYKERRFDITVQLHLVPPFRSIPYLHRPVCVVLASSVQNVITD